MRNMEANWGDAQVQFGDWIGTATFDHSNSTEDIQTFVGLEHEKWLIVGIEVSQAGDDLNELRVMAVPRDGRHLQQMIEDSGKNPLEVTEFLVHDVDPMDLLRRIAHAFNMRLRLREVVGTGIRVSKKGDIPEQED